MWRRPLFGMSLKSISNCQWKSNMPVALEDESETGGRSALSPSLDASARPPLLLLYPGFRQSLPPNTRSQLQRQKLRLIPTRLPNIMNRADKISDFLHLVASFPPDRAI